MKEKPKGGPRKGAGRKPSSDPKLPVTLFVETSKINRFGGKEAVQLFCYNAIDSDSADPEKAFPLSANEITQKAQDRPKIKLQPQILPDAPMVLSGSPRTLDELKRLCPANLTGWDRSEWIRAERQKYGI